MSEKAQMDVNIDYAADDSCQIMLWSRGHHEPAEFIAACQDEIKRWSGADVDLSGKPVMHRHYRTVRADACTAAIGVCETLHIESKPGRGAYAVTVLGEWLPLGEVCK